LRADLLKLAEGQRQDVVRLTAQADQLVHERDEANKQRDATAKLLLDCQEETSRERRAKEDALHELALARQRGGLPPQVHQPPKQTEDETPAD